jgi:hypothetical protein
MSEKRKPTLTIRAEFLGKVEPRKKKRMVYELFPTTLWPKMFSKQEELRYRIRVNGKWIDKSWTLTEFMKQLRGGLSRRLRK